MLFLAYRYISEAEKIGGWFEVIVHFVLSRSCKACLTIACFYSWGMLCAVVNKVLRFAHKRAVEGSDESSSSDARMEDMIRRLPWHHLAFESGAILAQRVVEVLFDPFLRIALLVATDNLSIQACRDELLGIWSQSAQAVLDGIAVSSTVVGAQVISATKRAEVVKALLDASIPEVSNMKGFR